MPFILYEEKYSIGIKNIDDQHQTLFNMVNDIHDAILHEQGNDVVKRMLNELVKYVIMHFTTEENYMKEHNFPDYSAHKQEHINLAKQIVELLHNVRKEGILSNSASIISFLKDWLLNHIVETDRLYADYITSTHGR